MNKYYDLHTIMISEDADITNTKFKNDLYDSFIEENGYSSSSSESECKFTLYAIIDENEINNRNSSAISNFFKKVFCF